MCRANLLAMAISTLAVAVASADSSLFYHDGRKLPSDPRRSLQPPQSLREECGRRVETSPQNRSPPEFLDTVSEHH